MTPPKDGGPAFPSAPILGATDSRNEQRDGMTLRDYFAAAALAGLLPGLNIKAFEKGQAEQAYRLADALLAAREKG